MASSNEDIGREPFSWKRTWALAVAIGLHAFAFLLIVAPMAPPHQDHKEKERKTSEKEDKKAVLQKLKSRRPPPFKGLPQMPERIVVASEETWHVRARSTAVVKYLRSRLPKPVVIIGVGGIDNAEAALEKLDAGADLVQVYTGLVYEGPRLIVRINEAFAQWKNRQ